jgi:NTE family protein
MNAVVFADGWLKGGRAGARAALADFWGAIGKQMPWGVARHGQGDAIALSLVGKLPTSWAGNFTPA